MRKHKAPSDKALKAIALKAVNPTMTKQDAALQAGYKPSTARNATKNIFAKPLVQTWLDNYQYIIEKSGLTQDKVAEKLKELIDASIKLRDKDGNVVGEIPNHKIQLETVKVYNDIFGVKDNGTGEKNTEGLKRRVLLEEFDEREVLTPLKEEKE